MWRSIILAKSPLLLLTCLMCQKRKNIRQNVLCAKKERISHDKKSYVPKKKEYHTTKSLMCKKRKNITRQKVLCAKKERISHDKKSYVQKKKEYHTTKSLMCKKRK